MPDCWPESDVRIRSTCLVAETCLSSSASTSSASRSEVVTRTAAASGSCSAWLIRSAATYAASAVSSARIAISVGPASESMPTRPLRSRLAVTTQMLPGTGHQVDASARADAVGEHRDRLGAADGVDLLDAQQRARREDRRVRQSAVVLLGARGQRDGADAGDLGGHDVHQHAGDERGESAGDVEPDAVDRHLAVRHRGSGTELGRDVLLELGLAGDPQPADRLLQAGADGRVERREGGRGRLDRHPDVGLLTPSCLADISRIASSPRIRTSSQIACTAGTAASTSKSARGTASR